MNTVTLLAVGDVMLARRVGEVIEQYGAFHPFEKISPVLQQAHLVIGNLEAPLSHRGQPKRAKPGDPIFRASPEAANGLRKAGFDVLSLANNHIFDYGELAFRDTLEVLNSVGIRVVGAGLNLEEALAPAIREMDGNRIAFLAFCNAQIATSRSPGTAPLDSGVVRSAIQSARRKADWVVVSFHQGLEYSDYPTSETIAQARQMIDAGGDVVIGHHPHVLQGMEQYNNGLIAYSLGNFVFDHHDVDLKQQALARSVMTRVGGHAADLTDERMAESVILRISLSAGQPPSHLAIPVRINAQYQPAPLEGIAAERLLKRLDVLSAPLSNLDAPEIRAADVIALKLRAHKLRHSPAALLRLRPRHIRSVCKAIARRVSGE